VAALVAVALLAVTACGGGSGGRSGGGPSTDDAAAGGANGAGPIRIEHKYGTTTLDAPPGRIVSLDNQWTDVLTALDAPLVGAALDPQIEGGRYPWQDGLPDDVEDIPVTDKIPYEAVAALHPDLIVVTWALQDAADYETLAAIAPTIPLLGDEQVDAWEDIARVAGEVVGEPARGQELVDEAEARSAEVRRELPGIEGRTFALANYVPGDAIHVVADPDDGSSRFFAQLGLEIDPDIVAMADGASGRTELSLERTDALDADLLVLFTNGADPTEIPGYDLLPAVRHGAVAVLDLAAVTGLNTPTPLSIPYSLDHIRPALEALDAPDPG
jgi:iron complex transport system substrate-binding protein